MSPFNWLPNIHPLLVHFPIALFCVAVGFHLWKVIFAKDDKYGELETFFSDKSVNEISSATGIQVRTVNVIKDSIDNKQYCQINQLLNLPNVGVRTLEKIFQLNQYKIKQDRLF